MLSILSCVCWQSLYLLWRNRYLGLLPIFGFGCLFFDIELHELLVYFGDYSFVSCFICKYFVPFWGLFFVFFMVSFAVKKLLSFIRSHLFIFVFISISLGGGSKKILLLFISWSVLSKFSSKTFIVSGLIFRSLIHFGLFFCLVLFFCLQLCTF